MTAVAEAIAAADPLPEGAPVGVPLSARLAAPSQTVIGFFLRRRGIDLSRPEAATSRCDEASRTLALLMHEQGIRVRLATVNWRRYGEDTSAVHHTVVLAPGRRVIDLTANQYARAGEAFPVPYTPDLAAWKAWLDRVEFRGKYVRPVTTVGDLGGVLR